MKNLDRRTFVRGLGAAITLGPAAFNASAPRARADVKAHPDLTKVNQKFLVTTSEAQAWHVAKDSMGGPTIAGSPSWKNYLQIAERELRACGVVDIFRNPWTYTRWYTTEYPDDSNWSLHLGGVPYKVASYGCNSGTTPEAGVTGELIIYEPGMPAESLKGKIAVVLKPEARVKFFGGPVKREDDNFLVSSGADAVEGDYEYLTNPETFPDPRHPRAADAWLSPFPQMGLGSAQQPLIEAGAAGALIVLPLTYEPLAGAYTFPVPALHQMPTLYIDLPTAANVVAAARTNQKATLRLIAKTEEAETYQLFGYLPGRNYGKPEDEQILFITHTDGPSISQENGPLGILAMVKYFSQIPQAARPRTIMIFLDCRHYMPGAERAFAPKDYAASHPDIYKKVVAAMGIEHLGQIQVDEGNGKPYHKTDQAELSTVWITENQKLVDMAIKAVNDNGLKRVQVQCPGRKGKHGGEQGPWYGLGGIARRIGVPGASTMGSMTAYWSSKARIEYFDAKQFVTQVATMSQIAGDLMVADMNELKSARRG